MDRVTKFILSCSIAYVVLTLFVAAAFLLPSFGINLENKVGSSTSDSVAKEDNNSSNQFFISADLLQVLNTNYDSSNKEFAACLGISQQVVHSLSDLMVSYMINGFETDIQFFGDSFSTMGYCNAGLIHSHPKGNCFFSVADIYSFKERIKKGEYFTVLMCGEDKLYYITRNDFTEKEVQIV